MPILEDAVSAQEKITNNIRDTLNSISNHAEIHIKFATDSTFRSNLIQNLRKSPIELTSGFVALFDKSLDYKWNQCKALSEYRSYIIFIMDIVENFTAATIPSMLTRSILDALNRFFSAKRINKSSFQSAMDAWRGYAGDWNESLLKEFHIWSKRDIYSDCEEHFLAAIQANANHSHAIGAGAGAMFNTSDQPSGFM